MKILLTGSTGQVGWELRRTLAPLGQIIAPVRGGMDLSAPDSVRTAIRSSRPDVIVNPAAYTAVDQAETQPDLAMAINRDAPGVMAQEAKRLGTLLIHYSTDYVFDGAKFDPYVETDAPHPLSVYGKSKLAGEEAIRESGCNHLILRTSWVYGSRGRNFLLTMLRLARERDHLRIVDDQIGAPTWCRMIAEATAVIAGRLVLPPGAHLGHGPTLPLPLEGWKAEESATFHLTAAGETSWRGFAQEIFRVAAERGICAAPRIDPIPTKQYPFPAARPMNSRLSNDKLYRAFRIALPAWQAQLEMCMDELCASSSPVAAD